MQELWTNKSFLGWLQSAWLLQWGNLLQSLGWEKCVPLALFSVDLSQHHHHPYSEIRLGSKARRLGDADKLTSLSSCYHCAPFIGFSADFNVSVPLPKFEHVLDKTSSVWTLGGSDCLLIPSFQLGPGPRTAASTATWARSCGPCSPRSTTSTPSMKTVSIRSPPWGVSARARGTLCRQHTRARTARAQVCTQGPRGCPQGDGEAAVQRGWPVPEGGLPTPGGPLHRGGGLSTVGWPACGGMACPRAEPFHTRGTSPPRGGLSTGGWPACGGMAYPRGGPFHTRGASPRRSGLSTVVWPSHRGVGLLGSLNNTPLWKGMCVCVDVLSPQKHCEMTWFSH